jgi:hypothetical protein
MNDLQLWIKHLNKYKLIDKIQEGKWEPTKQKYTRIWLKNDNMFILFDHNDKFIKISYYE